MKRKAVALLSGGLDSMLAVRVILGQGVPVTAVRFMTHFGCDADGTGSCGKDVSPLVKLWGPMGFTVKYCHLGQDYIDMVRSPRFGRGKNMNPCIDCRGMMLTWAKDVLEQEEACCLVTGEVLNQRPMSQTRSEFARIEKVTGLQGRVLRPLSARLLEPTIAEQEGFVDREKLLDLSGRSRVRQYAMAKEFGIESIPQPAGGCLLTDPGYSERLRELWRHDPQAGAPDINLLRVGRHFRPRPELKIIVGRNENENLQLQGLRQEGDALLQLKEFSGPMTLLRGTFSDADVELAASITVRYGDVPGKAEGAEAEVLVERGPGAVGSLRSRALGERALVSMRVGIPVKPVGVPEPTR